MAMSAPDARVTGLQSLFPPGIVVVERLDEGDIAALSPAEAACLGRAGLKRSREFAAGRQCARAALQQLGMAGWDLIVRPDRTPVWPEGVVGSISHTTGFCAVAAGHRQDWRAIGLDVEIDQRVTAELYPQFLTSVEQAWLRDQPITQADGLATLIFSAKEAFYKAQYPMTGEWLEFADLEIRLTGTGVIDVRPTRRLQLEASISGPWIGRYARFDGLVATGLAFPAEGRFLKRPVQERRDQDHDAPADEGGQKDASDDAPAQDLLRQGCAFAGQLYGMGNGPLQNYEAVCDRTVSRRRVRVKLLLHGKRPCLSLEG